MKKRKRKITNRKKINNKINIYLLILIIIIFFVVVSTAIKIGSSYPKETIQLPTPSPTPRVFSFNFTEIGYISDWDSKKQQETGEWFFLYENPGIPIIKVKLEFTDNSRCDFGQGEKLCSQLKLISGEKIKIEGQMQVDKLVVSKITRTNY